MIALRIKGMEAKKLAPVKKAKKSKVKEYDTVTTITVNDLQKGMFFQFAGQKKVFVVAGRLRSEIEYYPFDNACGDFRQIKKTSKRPVVVGFEF